MKLNFSIIVPVYNRPNEIDALLESLTKQHFSDDFEVGAGFGFRYLTPVGPVRIDHAWGLTKESKSTRLSITIGPEI